MSEWVNPINGVAAVAAECAPGGGAVGVRSEGPTDFVQAMELFTADYWAGHELRVAQDAAAAGASQGRRVLTVDYFKDIAFQQTHAFLTRKLFNDRDDWGCPSAIAFGETTKVAKAKKAQVKKAAANAKKPSVKKASKVS